LKEKVINAANDTNTDEDRATIQKELDQSIDQINDNANVTFNGKYLVDGSHNNKVTATTTSFNNESLAEGTKFTDKFTDLKDRNGNSLNITSLDTVTISFVKEGVTYTTQVNFDASTNKANIGSKTLEDMINAANSEYQAKGGSGDALKAMSTSSYIGKDINGDTVGTPDKKDSITISGVRASENDAIRSQISGITISVSDTKGNIKKSVNAVLDNFSEKIRAEDKSADNAISLQVGSKANQTIKVGLKDMRAEALGLASKDGKTIQIGTRDQANAAISVLDTAVQKALDQQTTIGSVQSRLQYTSSNLTTASENVQASESTIRDADMAKEMTEYTKNNVLLQAAQSMLSQANQNSSSVLSLLQ